ncbi:MAG: hypothetical protein K6A34_04055 [Methanobrevibacter sp.]|nr:hypothetical protein [Methanobrevibacter sp.]
MGFLSNIFGKGNEKKENNKETPKKVFQDVDSILEHFYGKDLNFRTSSRDSIRIIDNLAAEGKQPLLAELAIKSGNKTDASYAASLITDEKLLIDVAKNALNRDARTTAIRSIRENPDNEEELIYIARHDPWYFNRRVAISYINDKSALNEMLNDSSILNNLREPKYDRIEDYKKNFKKDVTERLEKLED